MALDCEDHRKEFETLRFVFRNSADREPSRKLNRSFQIKTFNALNTHGRFGTSKLEGSQAAFCKLNCSNCPESLEKVWDHFVYTNLSVNHEVFKIVIWSDLWWTQRSAGSWMKQLEWVSMLASVLEIGLPEIGSAIHWSPVNGWRSFISSWTPWVMKLSLEMLCCQLSKLLV